MLALLSHQDSPVTYEKCMISTVSLSLFAEMTKTKMKVMRALFPGGDNREEGNKCTILSSLSPNIMTQKILAATAQALQRRGSLKRKQIKKDSPNGNC